MSRETRKYESKVRAERQAQTRERIVEATMELHEEVGPARTTVAEIARRAGVQRLTVYNHFPDEAHLFPACQAHWMAQHPIPDFGPAFALEDPGARVREVLRLLYGRHRATEAMTTHILSDRGAVPVIDALLEQSLDVQMAQLAAALAAGFRLRGRRAERLSALVALSLDFWTWRRLAREGLDDRAAADLMADTVVSAGRQPPA